MAIPVEMPKMSDTMEEGVLAAWQAEEGQDVAAGDVIAQVETDKATMDLEVYDDGVLLKKVIGEGDAVPIGGLIAVLGQKGEDISAILAKYEGGGDGSDGQSPDTAAAAQDDAESDSGAAASQSDGAAESRAHKPAPEKGAAAPESQGTSVPASPDGSRTKASPLARKMASENDIDLSSISGSGPDGRIIKRDIEDIMAGGQKARPADTGRPAESAAATPRPAAQAPAPAAEGDYDAVRISQMRKTIARRLAESKFTSPHFYLTADIDMERAVAFRTQINELAAAKDGPKVSYNDIVTKACALALRKHTWVNASWVESEGEIRLHHDIHVAIAVAVDEGLLTPVIRHADRKGLGQIATETKELAGRARTKDLQPEEFSGSTFSTSNLGMFGIEEFTAIINPPNACILAIGAIRDTPVVKNGSVVPGKRMKVTLSCDHRVVDGATGSEFLATVRGYLENPLTMLL